MDKDGSVTSIAASFMSKWVAGNIKRAVFMQDSAVVSRFAGVIGAAWVFYYRHDMSRSCVCLKLVLKGLFAGEACVPTKWRCWKGGVASTAVGAWLSSGVNMNIVESEAT